VTLTEFEALLETLPRRYPGLLIDRIEECLPGQSARAQKYVTVNEPYFQGHFPGYPVMPGVLVLEALVQLSTFLAAASGLPLPNTIRTLDSIRFKRQVIPGDRLTLDTVMQADGRFDVRASVDGELATEGTIVLGKDS
jgi:3-hydroxyacyl-[acyl-carrier-protein] dehydratase